MNNPERNVLGELQAFASWGFDFVELAIEGPRALPEELLARRREIGDMLSTFNAPPIAHVPWYFYVGHPYPGVRRAYLKETLKVLETAAKLDCTLVGLHIHEPRGLYSEKLKGNIDALREVARHASRLGVKLAVENLEEEAFSVEDFKAIFHALPEVKFLFDIGHANMRSLEGKAIFSFIKNFSERMAHVHAHDNLGEGDDHLPIGAGNIDWPRVAAELRKVYDGTITLEIHSPDPDYLRISKEKFTRIWGL
jgi:sugar phosphate isomerase/epimerase